MFICVLLPIQRIIIYCTILMASFILIGGRAGRQTLWMRCDVPSRVGHWFGVCYVFDINYNVFTVLYGYYTSGGRVRGDLPLILCSSIAFSPAANTDC